MLRVAFCGCAGGGATRILHVALNGGRGRAGRRTYPGKAEHHRIRMALRSGIIAGVFKKHRASYRVVAGLGARGVWA